MDEDKEQDAKTEGPFDDWPCTDCPAQKGGTPHYYCGNIPTCKAVTTEQRAEWDEAIVSSTIPCQRHGCDAEMTRQAHGYECSECNLKLEDDKDTIWDGMIPMPCRDLSVYTVEFFLEHHPHLTREQAKSCSRSASHGVTVCPDAMGSKE